MVSLFKPLLRLVKYFLPALSVGVCIERDALSAFAPDKLVYGHIGFPAFYVPQCHIHAADGVVPDRPVAPVAVVVHQVPQLLYLRCVPSDHKRLYVFLNGCNNSLAALRICCAAVSVKSRLVCVHADDHEVYAVRAGYKCSDISYFCQILPSLQQDYKLTYRPKYD